MSDRLTLRHVALAATALCLLASPFIGGCGSEEQIQELIIPRSLFGYMKASGGESSADGTGVTSGTGDYSFVIVWTGGGSLAVGYNVYRKIGAGSFEKLNEALVQPGRLGNGPGSAVGLTFADTTMDQSSTSEHLYYVTAEDETGLETPPSGLISCVPAVFDPSASIGGLAPDTTSDVSTVPVFSWAPISRATSYCVFLTDGGSGVAGDVIWVHRVGQPPVTYKSTKGTTYADAAGDALKEGADHTWLVLAIDSRNCAFATGEASFSTSAPARVSFDEEG